MTNEELLQDLKQLITATISQQMANVATKDDLRDLRREVKTDLKEVEQRLTARIDGLEAKIDRVQDAVADTLTRVAEALDTTHQVGDLERRVTRLEHGSA